MIDSFLSRDCKISDIEQRKDRKRKIEQKSRKEMRRKGEKGTIKVMLHRVAASVLKRDGTAVFEEGEVDRQTERERERRKRRMKK